MALRVAIRVSGQCSELDRAVSRMVPWRKELTKTHGAGRTDKGVHATGQVIHFDLPRVHRTTGEDMEPLSPSTVKEALNFHLTACEAHEVRVVDAQVVDKSLTHDTVPFRGITATVCSMTHRTKHRCLRTCVHGTCGSP